MYFVYFINMLQSHISEGSDLKFQYLFIKVGEDGIFGRLIILTGLCIFGKALEVRIII